MSNQISDEDIDKLLKEAKIISGKVNTAFFLDIILKTGFKLHVESIHGHGSCMTIAHEKVKELELYRQSWDIYLRNKGSQLIDWDR